METKGYYATVGFFVILFSTIGIIIGLWLSVGLHTKSYDYYTIYINESVAGLSVSAAVKYNGVDVGIVKAISLSQRDPNQVRLTIAVDNGTPVTTATRATLNMQGVTGIAYVELRDVKDKGPVQPLRAQAGQKYPVILSSPSLLFRMDVAVERISEDLQGVVDSVGMVFNKKNGALFQDTLSNVEVLTRTLKNNDDKLNRIIENMAAATDKMPSLMDNAQQSMVRFNQLSVRLDNAANSVQLTLNQSDATLQTINNQILPLVMSVLGNIDGFTLRLDDFTQQLSDNPSMLIRGQAPLPLGPGETRATPSRRN
ncbi:MAG: MlaD family protein [Gammaproteobacteria bacterium]|nr:MlaD family protein [Gammaproteobacteria bacterium]